MLHNFTYIQEHFIEWSLQGYEDTLGILFWGIIFTSIIGYVYLKQQSAVAAVAAILIIISSFGSYLLYRNSPLGPWMILLYIIVGIVITGLFLIFINRRRG